MRPSQFYSERAEAVCDHVILSGSGYKYIIKLRPWSEKSSLLRNSHIYESVCKIPLKLQLQPSLPRFITALLLPHNEVSHQHASTRQETHTQSHVLIQSRIKGQMHTFCHQLHHIKHCMHTLYPGITYKHTLTHAVSVVLHVQWGGFEDVSSVKQKGQSGGLRAPPKLSCCTEKGNSGHFSRFDRLYRAVMSLLLL